MPTPSMPPSTTRVSTPPSTPTSPWTTRVPLVESTDCEAWEDYVPKPRNKESSKGWLRKIGSWVDISVVQVESGDLGMKFRLSPDGTLVLVALGSVADTLGIVPGLVLQGFKEHGSTGYIDSGVPMLDDPQAVLPRVIDFRFSTTVLRYLEPSSPRAHQALRWMHTQRTAVQKMRRMFKQLYPQETNLDVLCATQHEAKLSVGNRRLLKHEVAQSRNTKSILSRGINQKSVDFLQVDLSI
ncbi:hypothetical protein H310_09318 [Aphanomyces invadans]|uniref:Uncharacterized protein n=1 Tax=Aphanomyces invadans TaxID=157072 RepID=A0A024TXF4_9STRA|nr:hypothetical protein H310_09318 [Aphanomyces invadans]ETV98017.1 hypothetical protein H310_09318 [Aphanomyces invadans]|eukprot:XP_008873578.1 hypothetical protein H310_09318 [Aphanomyces invadans]